MPSINSTSVIKFTSNTVFHDDAVTWKDLEKPLFGRRIDTSAGKLDYNYTKLGVDFPTGIDITNNTHCLLFTYQINHEIKLDGQFWLHCHWWQEQAATPNWWLKYRICKNGYDAGSWIQLAWNENVETYSSGTILQMTKFPVIDLAPLNLGLSDHIQMAFTRDDGNDSGLFSGSDGISGSVCCISVDAHVQVDSNGSRTELSKT
ncbi:MAG: hypothetical protein ACTSRA_12295 [Promethearchaeota archaeon]